MTRVSYWTTGSAALTALVMLAIPACNEHGDIEARNPSPTPTQAVEKPTPSHDQAPPANASTSDKAGRPVMVYLLAGQSNMVGSGTPKSDLPKELQAPQADVEFYHAAGPGPLQENAWVPLQPGSTVDFGPEVTFGRSIADRFPSERVALIKYAVGNTDLARKWDPDTGQLYRAFAKTAKAGLKALADRGDTYEIAGMVWMQGESDSAYPEMAAAYETNLTALIARVRRDFDVPDLPFVIGRIYIGVHKGFRNDKQVRTAQAAVAQRDGKAAWVDLDGLDQQDAGVEFNGPGTVEMGKRFAETMQRLRQ